MSRNCLFFSGLLSMFVLSLNADELKSQNSVKFGYEYRSGENIQKSYGIESVVQSKLKYQNDNSFVVANIYAQKAFDDDQRSFVAVNEAYLKTNLGTSAVTVGKEIKHWGVLENNLVDIFNKNNNLINPLETNKIGAVNFTYDYFIGNNNNISAIVKADEMEDKFSSASPLYPFASFAYDSHLKDKHRPSYYIKFDGTSEKLDYSLVFMRGYDDQRDLLFDYLTYTFSQNVYTTNKYMAFGTYKYRENILLKFEGIFTDVDNYQAIGSYSQIGIGGEYTATIGETDTNYVLEYYRYATCGNSKKSSRELNILLQNDLLASVSISYNDFRSTTLNLSTLIDLDDPNERVYKIGLESRMDDKYLIGLSYAKINASNSFLPKKFDSLRFEIKYSF